MKVERSERVTVAQGADIHTIPEVLRADALQVAGAAYTRHQILVDWLNARSAEGPVFERNVHLRLNTTALILGATGTGLTAEESRCPRLPK